MKERIVITDSQAIDEWNRTIACYVDTDNSIYKAKFEKVPENFEELKELCKDMYADITEHSITLFGCLEFWDDGKLSFFHYADIVNNLKPAQMWQIIKSLIGDER